LNRETADAGKPRFKFKRIRDGEYGWIATSGYENAGRYRGFTAAGKALADVKRFAKIVRWCERTGKMEDLSWQVVPLEEGTGIQTIWGGTFGPF
jgi:hypothetical protein